MQIIGGKFGRRLLAVPKGTQTRPSASRLRESFFNICQNSIEGSSFLDLFAGSGAIGLEAISRGAKEVTFVEMHRTSASVIQKNITSFEVEPICRLLSIDVFHALKILEGEKKSFSLIYADPPYKTIPKGFEVYYSHLILHHIDTCSLLAQGGSFFLEEAFSFAPKIQELKTLSLKSSRRIGEACLQEYIKL